MEYFRWTIKYILSLVLYYSGMIFLFRYIRTLLGRTDVKILTYHGVSDRPNYIDMFMGVDEFERQIRYLKKTYKIVSMDELTHMVRVNEKPKRDAVALTFDDGYKDNYLKVYPILRKYNVAGLIYLTTAPIEKGRPTFIEYLLLAIDKTEKLEINLENWGLKKYKLNNRTSKRMAILGIDEKEKGLEKNKRIEFLKDVIGKLGYSLDHPLFLDRMLTWTEIKEMKNHGIDFGCHTVSHPVLAHLSMEEVDKEVADSKKMLEKRVGGPIRHFAYPYGGRNAVGSYAPQSLQKHEFESGVVLYRKELTPQSLFSLGRIMVSEQMVTNPFGRFSRSLFACEMSGLYDFFFKRS